ncbi:MAG: DUF6447 family protein [Gammaproteobacteria bacterium]|nr:DUF6447 family protein [Gammaproteobacteria bacterium]
MAKITLDEKEYDTEQMSEGATAQLQALQFVNNEITMLKLRGAALETAKNAYIRALKSILEEGEGDGDEATIDLPDDLNFD